jgi:hypothetical protein
MSIQSELRRINERHDLDLFYTKRENCDPSVWAGTRRRGSVFSQVP